MTTFEEAIDKTGHGKFNYLVLVTCGLVLLYTYSESLGTGYMIPAAQCDLHLSVNQKGLVNAATFIGIVVTAIIWGYLSDNYGRRKVMLPALMCNVLASGASSLSRGFIELLLLRILTGCMVSASSATVFAYLGELTTAPHRARFMAFGAMFIALSFIELPALAWLIMYHELSITIGNHELGPWRLFMWSWGISGILAITVLIFLPESPRFLFSNYGPESALPVLRKMYAWNHNRPASEYPVQHIDTGEHAAVYQHGLKVAWKNLGQMFKPPLLRCVVISHGTMFMAFFMSSGLFTWMPEILDETLDNIATKESICYIMKAKYAREKCTPADEEKILNDLLYPVTIIMGFISTLGYATVGVFVTKFGKRAIYWTIIFFSTTLLCGAGLVPSPPVAIGLYLTGMVLGIAPSVLAAISVEVFPTCVRALALCTLYMMGRLGAAVGSVILGMGLPKHCELVFVISLLSVAVSSLLFCMWPNPDTVRQEMESRGFYY